ncbi:solute carrier family 35 member G1 [Hydra vulgaris]|uniref:Solute carrier family 35 member G1 n=1 Tax=Hydra vulgaris TaxID=6087 RepID=A0ABM4D9D8_HYDVU
MFQFFSKIFLTEDGLNQRTVGLALMAAAGLFLTLGNVLVQYIYHIYKDLSTYEMLLLRSFIQLLFSIVFMFSRKVHPYGDKKLNLLYLIFMGVVEDAAIIFFYLALQLIPIADATVVQFTSPVFTVFFSYILLRKGCGIIEVLCGCISFFGVVVIAKPDLIIPNNGAVPINQLSNNVTSVFQNPQYMLGSGFALLAAMSISLFLILIKLHGSKFDLTLTVFYPSILGIIFSPIAMLIRHDQFLFQEIKAQHWYIIVISGIVFFVGLMLMAEALQLEDAGPAILIRNCDVIYAFVLQYLLMSQLPSRSALLGTFIVLGSSSVMILHRVFNLQQQCCKKCCGNKCINQEPIQVEEEKHFMLNEFVEEDEELNN